MKGLLSTSVVAGLLSVVCLFGTLQGPAWARGTIPVKWGPGIFPGWINLGPYGQITRPSQFLSLYQKWSRPVSYAYYIGTSTGPARHVVFRNCGELLGFVKNLGETHIFLNTGLDRYRFWNQVGTCQTWRVIPRLQRSVVSYLPPIVGNMDSPQAVHFFRQLVELIAHDKAQIRKLRNPFFRRFTLGWVIPSSIKKTLPPFLKSGWLIDCNPYKCNYDVFEDSDMTVIFTLFAQGDYNGNGINDFLISAYAPSGSAPTKGYPTINLVVTRQTKGGPLKIIGEY